MTIVYFILGGFARRWFGGMFDNCKILGNRGLQTAFMLALFMSIYLTNIHDWKSWLVAIAVSCWLQFQEVSRGHGACFDIGRGAITPEIVKRYNERWYHIPCDYCADKGYFTRYGVVYDFMYMTLRYTMPMMLMAIIDSRYLIIGFMVSCVYALCWELYEWKPQLFTKISFISAPTELAEIVWGGLFYAGCYAIGLN